MSYQLDATDLRILSALQQDAVLPNNELARQLEMAPSAVLGRVKKLEQKGVIENYTACIKPEAVELKLLAYISVKTNEGPGIVSGVNELLNIPEVQEVHHVAGEDCYLVKVRTRDSQSLVKLMREKFSTIPGLISTKTTIVLETLKESNHLPIPTTL